MKNLPRLLLLAGLAGFTSAHAETAAVPAAPAAPATEVAVSKPFIGNAAPEFKPTAWVQGEPVTGYEKGKVYIIECWATWCGPCIAMIPHLNELHKKFADKGLVVIGTNVSDKTKEHAAEFVKKQGDAMSYRIAFDEPRTGPIGRDWLQATGARGIPHAFAVRDGKVLWSGHPAGLSDSIVSAMLAGTFDSAMAAAEQKASEEKAAKNKAIQQDIVTFTKEKKYDEALKKVDELEALADARSKPYLDIRRATILGNKDVAEGVAKMAKLVADNPKEKLFIYQAGLPLLRPPFKGDKAAAKLALECANRLRELDPEASPVKAFYKQASAAAAATEGEAKPAATEAK
jgi:thiol-disulfide isomerase/thioredoxin